MMKILTGLFWNWWKVPWKDPSPLNFNRKQHLPPHKPNHSPSRETWSPKKAKVLNQRTSKIPLLRRLRLAPSFQTKVEILEMRLPKTSPGARNPLPERTLQIRNPITYYATYLKEYRDQISESQGVSPQHVLTSPPLYLKTHLRREQSSRISHSGDP